jgi:hypothetical protein
MSGSSSVVGGLFVAVNDGQLWVQELTEKSSLKSTVAQPIHALPILVTSSFSSSNQQGSRRRVVIVSIKKMPNNTLLFVTNRE